MSCDIGIVSFDCFPELEKCIESILLRERDAVGGIFVIENSKKAIPKALKERFPEVQWEKSKENLGFAKACNRIIAKSSADFILLLNPDTVMINCFLAKAMEWLQEHEDVAVLGPRILDHDGKVQASARGFPSLSTAFFGRSSLLSRLFPSNALTQRNLLTSTSQDSPVEVDWVSGACLMARAKAIADTGLLDEGFFMYWEDCDWCTRFRNNGWKVVYHPGLGPVKHMAGSSSKKARFLSHFHFHKSAARLYAKYDSTPLRAGTFMAVSGALVRFILLFPGVLAKQCR